MINQKIVQRTFFTFRFSSVRSTKLLRLWDEYKANIPLFSLALLQNNTKPNKKKKKNLYSKAFQNSLFDCWCYNESRKKCVIKFKCGFSFHFHCSCDFFFISITCVLLANEFFPIQRSVIIFPFVCWSKTWPTFVTCTLRRHSHIWIFLSQLLLFII